jgi:hypothetical protein
MTRDRRFDGRRAAAKRHMHEVEVQRMLEQRADELRRRAGSRRRIAVFAGIGPEGDLLFCDLRRILAARSGRTST